MQIVIKTTQIQKMIIYRNLTNGLANVRKLLFKKT